MFKKVAAENVENYRPISSTGVAGKIMERLIAKQIYDHLKCNDLLSCMQHGFLNGKSACTNLLEAANDWKLQDKVQENTLKFYALTIYAIVR